MERQQFDRRCEAFKKWVHIVVVNMTMLSPGENDIDALHGCHCQLKARPLERTQVVISASSWRNWSIGQVHSLEIGDREGD